MDSHLGKETIRNLESWLRSEANKREQAAKSRRECASTMRDATPDSLAEGRRLAESMIGRKLPKTTPEEARKAAELDERIASKVEAESIQLTQFADAIAELRAEVSSFRCCQCQGSGSPQQVVSHEGEWEIQYMHRVDGEWRAWSNSAKRNNKTKLWNAERAVRSATRLQRAYPRSLFRVLSWGVQVRPSPADMKHSHWGVQRIPLVGFKDGKCIHGYTISQWCYECYLLAQGGTDLKGRDPVETGPEQQKHS
jgi:hypothetical protein